MLDLLNAVEKLFPRSPSEPAVAAAVTVLANVRLPQVPPDRLNAGLQAVAPHLSEEERAQWITILAAALCKADISTYRCVAAFLGQCAIETGGFRSLEEELGYSVVRLCQVWPNRFPNAEAAEAYAMQPEILANQIYANRMGNGDAASGDGWRFRGRGLFQLTGRSAYEHFALAMNMTLDQAIDHAASTAGAADSAAWFWTAKKLNTLANSWSLDRITETINGGMSDAAERSRLCEAALKAIGA